ncbi:MAG TPA: hypothetical protein VFM56_03870, partial [Solimonas sp.]|nr:hypothetical protein [Solimonas sp.]
MAAFEGAGQASTLRKPSAPIVIASAAKQSSAWLDQDPELDCFVASLLAMTDKFLPAQQANSLYMTRSAEPQVMP